MIDTVWKWHLRLDVDGPQKLSMPAGARILTAQEQESGLELWALVDVDAAKEVRSFVVCGTGKDARSTVDLSKAIYISTVQFRGEIGTLVVHVFEHLDKNEDSRISS